MFLNPEVASALSFDRQSSEDLILILAQDQLLNDASNYPGLSGEYGRLPRLDLEQRIKRYAQNLSKTNDSANTHIISVSKNQSELQIANLLKQIYLGNSEEFENQNLLGIVLVGKVPIPQVVSADQMHVSMYPYTDFIDPAYKLNLETQSFEFNEDQSLNPQPEIWHGVIDFQTPQELAAYLDKNHLYYEQHPDFANIQKQAFVAEPNFEVEGLNDGLIDKYANFLSIARYLVANKVSAELYNQLTDSQQDVPDKYALQLLNSQFVKFIDLFANSIAKTQQEVTNLGRYNDTEYQSPLVAMAKIDQLAVEYFHEYNQALKQAFLQVVPEVAKNLGIPKAADLSAIVRSRSGETQRLNTVKFINHGRERGLIEALIDVIPGLQTALDVAEELPGPFTTRDMITEVFDFVSSDSDVINSHMPQIAGIDADELNSVAGCRLYNGGGLGLPGESTITYWRAKIDNQNPADLKSDCFPSASELTEDGKIDEDDWQKPSTVNDNIECTLFGGEDLRDRYRTSSFELDYPSRLSFESCYAFRTINEFRRLYTREYDNVAISRRVAEFNNQDHASLNLGSAFGQNINLADLIPQLPGFSGQDANDWHAWSFYLLGNPYKNQFTIQNPYSQAGNIESITLVANQQQSVRNLSSLTVHDAPTPEHYANLKPAGRVNLPVDSHPYVSFVDFKGDVQRMLIPNIFDSQSFAEFTNKVQQLDQQLQSLGANTSLQTLINQQLTTQPRDSKNANKKIVQFSVPKLEFLVDYFGLDINQKYTQVLKAQLDQNFQVDLFGAPQTYEIAHITAESNQDSVIFSLLSNPSLFEKRLAGSLADSDLEGLEPEEEDDGNFEALETYFTEYLPKWYDQTVGNLEQIFTEGPIDPLSFDDEIFNTNVQVSYFSADAPLQDILLAKQTATVNLSLLDQNNNPVAVENAQATVEIQGPAEFIGLEDQDEFFDGLQINLESATQELKLKLLGPGQVRVQARLVGIAQKLLASQDFEFDTSASFAVHSNLQTQIQMSQRQTYVGSTDPLRISYKLVDANSRAILSQAPALELSNKNLGQLKALSTEAKAFEHLFEFTPGTAAGSVEIKFPEQSKTIDILAGSAKRLVFSDLEDLELNVSKVNRQELNVLALDEYDNVASSFNQALAVQLSNPELVELSQPELNFVNGRARLEFTTKLNQFGRLTIKINTENLASNVTSASKSVKLMAGLSSAEISNFKSRALIYNFVTENSEYSTNRASRLLSSGVTQAVITSSKDRFKPSYLASLSPIGGISVLDKNILQPDIKLEADKIALNINDANGQLIASSQYQPQNIDFKLNEGLNQKAPGIYVNLLNPELKFKDSEILLDKQALVSFNANKIPQINDSAYTLKLVDNNQGLDLALFNADAPVAQILYIFGASSEIQFFKNPAQSQFNFASINLGANSNYPPSFIITNARADKSQDLLEDRQSSRLDSAFNGFGTGDRVNLFLAAGNSVGHSVRAKQDLGSIVLGDPNITLPKITPEFQSSMLFDQSIGKYLGSLPTNVSNVLVLQDMILFSDENGYISVLDKDSLKLSSQVALIPGGIKNMLTIKDGNTQEILVLSKQECLVQDDCLYLLKATDNGITLSKPSLNPATKVHQIYNFDLDSNGSQDLVTFNQDRSINLYLNPNFQRDNAPISLSALRRSLDSFNIDKFDLLIDAPEGESIALKNADGSSQQLKFASLVNTTKFADSSIRINSSTGQYLQYGQDLDITINLVANSSTRSSKVLLDLPAELQIDKASIQPDTVFAQDTSSPVFDLALSGLNIRPNTVNQISFKAKFMAPSDFELHDEPIISLAETQTGGGLLDLDIFYAKQDSKTHLALSLQNQRLRFSHNQLPISQEPPPAPDTNTDPEVQLGQSRLALVNGLDSGSSDSQDVFDMQNQIAGLDSDGDGFADEVDSYINSGDKLLDDITTGIKDLFCDGAGCLNVPINKAFLVPPTSPVPIFAWGCPNITTIAFGTAGLSCIGGRIYLSPTLTGEFASSVCLGPYFAPPVPGGPCFTATLFDLGALCDSINKKVNKLLTKATKFMTKGTEKAIGIGLELTSKPNIALPGFPAFLSNWYISQFDEIVKVLDMPDITLILPDFSPVSNFKFASIDTDRIDPFPDCPSFIANTKKCGNYKTQQEFEKATKSYINKLNAQPEELLSELSKMPLIDLVPRKIPIRLPVLPERIELKYHKDLLETIDANVRSFLTAIADWGCLPVPDFQTLDAQKKQYLENLQKGYIDDFFPPLLKYFFEAKGSSNTNFSEVGIGFVYKSKDYATFEAYGNAVTKDATDFTGLIQMILDGEFSPIIRFGNYHDLNKPGSSNRAKACIDLAVKFEGIASGLNESYQNLIAYRNLPKQLFEFQNILYYYSDQAIKYVDVIMNEYLGFIGRNTTQIQSWTKTIQKIQRLIADINILVEISSKFVKTCDDCRSNRTNSEFALLMDLLLQAPNLPVLTFPKLPDFVLDLSEIEANLELEIPIPVIQKEVLDLPTFKPVIIWPPAPDLDFIAVLDGVKLPVIPAPPDFINDFELKPLPELKLVKLPTLPNPPDLELLNLDLEGKLRIPLEFLKKFLNILCLLRKGLLPTPENALATHIASITNRSLTPVMPWDKVFKINFPGFQQEYVEKYKYTLQTRLNFDYMGVADLVEDSINDWNNLVNIRQIYDKIVKDFNKSLDRKFEIFTGLESLQSQLDIESQIQALPAELQKIQASLDSVQAALGESNVHTTTTESLDYESLNQKLSTVKPSLSQDLLSPQSQATIAQARKFLDSYKPTQSYEQVAPRLLANSQQVSLSSEPNKFLRSKTIQLAESPTDQAQSLQDITPQVNPDKGIYVVDNNQQVQSIVKNTQQLQSFLEINLDDVNTDGDTDVVYTSNTNFFLKQNLKFRQSTNSIASATKVYEFSDLNTNSSLLDLSANTSSYSTDSKQLTVSVPTQLLGLGFIVDIYKNALNSTNPDSRHVFSDTIPLEQVVTARRVVVQDNLIKSDGFAAMHLSNQNTGSLQVSLPLGVYSYDLSVILPTGIKVIDRAKAFAVSVCGDRVAPVIIVEPQDSLAVFRAKKHLDFSKSFDEHSGIKQIFIDTNLTVDSNQDSDPHNDPDIVFEASTPIKELELGPFNDFKPYELNVIAYDNANNKATKKLSYSVVKPQITLETVNTQVIKGYIEPAAKDFPIEIIQKRAGSSSSFANASTDKDGKFRLDTLELYANKNPQEASDSLQEKLNNSSEIPLTINNSQLDQLFEISKTTGSIRPLVQRARVQVSDFSTLDKASRLDLYENNTFITSILKKADHNVSVAIVESFKDLLDAKLAVTITDLNKADEFVVENIGFLDPALSGGAYIADSTGVLFVISPDGSVISSSPKITQQVEKIQDISKPQRVLVYYSGKNIAAYNINGLRQTQVAVATSRDLDVGNPLAAQAASDRLPEQSESQSTQPQALESQTSAQNLQQRVDTLITQAGLDLSNKPTLISLLSSKQKAFLNKQTSSFADIDPDSKQAQALEYLRINGVIEGTTVGTKTYFYPGKLITRAEYAKIVLKILCIKPRPESFLLPSVFDDIDFDTKAWFYDETKETFLQGFFEGYQGERNPQSLLTPFKALNPISRIEAVKVIMEALSKFNILDLSQLKIQDPWYLDYLRLSTDLNPILKSQAKAKASFLLTPTEALEPNKFLTRLEFAEIATRALDIRNCIADRSQANLPLEDILRDPSLDPLVVSKQNQQEFLNAHAPLLSKIQDLIDQAIQAEDLASTQARVQDGQAPLGTQTQDAESAAGQQTSDPADQEQGLDLEKQTQQLVKESLEQISKAILAITIKQQAKLEKQPVQVKQPKQTYVETIECKTCPCPYTIDDEVLLDDQDEYFVILRNLNKTQILDVSNILTLQ